MLYLTFRFQNEFLPHGYDPRTKHQYHREPEIIGFNFLCVQEKQRSFKNFAFASMH